MRKKFFVLAIASLIVYVAQGQIIEVKKCKTCGKQIKECQYNGEHPIPQKPLKNIHYPHNIETKKTKKRSTSDSVNGIIHDSIPAKKGIRQRKSKIATGFKVLDED